MLDLKRREFIALLGSTSLLCAAKARRARAQQTAIPVIGFLNSTSPGPHAPMVAAFRQGLARIMHRVARFCMRVDRARGGNPIDGSV